MARIADVVETFQNHRDIWDEINLRRYFDTIPLSEQGQFWHYKWFLRVMCSQMPRICRDGDSTASLYTFGYTWTTPSYWKIQPTLTQNFQWSRAQYAEDTQM